MNEIKCPQCHHSLGFHSYDHGICEAPLGGLTTKEVCGCPMTLHIYIEELNKKDLTLEIERVKGQLDNAMSSVVDSMVLLMDAQTKITRITVKLENIQSLVNQLLFMRYNPFTYKSDVVKIMEEIMKELG